MNTGLLQRLRQSIDQLMAYVYSVVFVLIGGRIMLFVQQTHGSFWPCDYVDAWWQVQGSKPTVLKCLESGRESTVVLSIALALGLVFVLVRQLEWRLRLIACVSALYFFLRLGYVINALGREDALSVFGQAFVVIRFELAGVVLFSVLLWLVAAYPRFRRQLSIAIVIAMTAAIAIEFISTDSAQSTLLLKNTALTLFVGLLVWFLGKLPDKTTRVLLGRT